MIYRKLVTSLNGLHKSVFYYWENLFLLLSANFKGKAIN